MKTASQKSTAVGHKIGFHLCLSRNWPVSENIIVRGRKIYVEIITYKCNKRTTLIKNDKQ